MRNDEWRLESAVSRTFESNSTVLSYHRCNAWLVTSLVIVGFLTFTLVIMVVNQSPSVRSGSALLIMEQHAGDNSTNGGQAPLANPKEVSLPELAVTTLSKILESVVLAVDQITDQPISTGTGLTVIRGAGPSSGDLGVVCGVRPPHKRWMLEYRVADSATYAQLLSQFGIAIGVVPRTVHAIWKVADPGGEGRVIESSRQQENKRNASCFGHRHVSLRRWDTESAPRPGVDTEECLIVQFSPVRIVELLKQLATTFAANAGRSLDEIRTTVFELTGGESGFGVAVTDQRCQPAMTSR